MDNPYEPQKGNIQMERTVEIFGRNRIYDSCNDYCYWETINDIVALTLLAENIEKPYILTPDGCEPVTPFKDRDFVLRMNEWLYANVKKTESKHWYDRLLDNAQEDTEWTAKQRDKDLLYGHICCRKITFNKDVQIMVKKEIRRVITGLQKVAENIRQEKTENGTMEL